jgi:hypothetical protein
VDHAFLLQSLADTGLDQQLDGSVLEDAGANALLDVFAASILEDDGLDALQMQQVAEEEPGGPGPDDSDLSPH